MAGEKTEKATAKRKSDERKKGNIFQSQEIVMVFSLIIMFYALQSMGPDILQSIGNSTRDFIAMTSEVEILTITETRQILIRVLILFASTVLPLLLISGMVAVGFTLVQTRLLFTMKSMEFKFSRLNPLQGIKRMFSLRALVALAKSLLKVVILAAIIYNSLYEKILLLPRLMDLSVEKSIAYLGDLIMSILTSSAAVFIAIAALDYIYQWWDYEKNLRMSKQEVKEEYKQTEGDPQIKGQIRDRQRKMASQRMMQNVPGADVIIRNPTHYAVAVKYDPEKDRAPIVVAKGADNLALRIIREAEKHQIVITENKPLARGLYEAVEVDREIPAEFYQAVAEVLVFVYNLRKLNPTQ